MAFDPVAFWNTLMQVYQQFSGLSNSLNGVWTQLMNQLPPGTAFWFTLAVIFTIGNGIASLTAKVTKALTIICWAVFLILFVKAEMHW